jgi:hypothetical protein
MSTTTTTTTTSVTNNKRSATDDIPEDSPAKKQPRRDALHKNIADFVDVGFEDLEQDGSIEVKQFVQKDGTKRDAIGCHDSILLELLNDASLRLRVRISEELRDEIDVKSSVLLNKTKLMSAWHSMMEEYPDEMETLENDGDWGGPTASAAAQFALFGSVVVG